MTKMTWLFYFICKSRRFSASSIQCDSMSIYFITGMWKGNQFDAAIIFLKMYLFVQHIKGNRGDDGSPGKDGIDGYPGSRGISGPTGPQGPPGKFQFKLYGLSRYFVFLSQITHQY